jgi:hypothetical protein
MDSWRITLVRYQKTPERILTIMPAIQNNSSQTRHVSAAAEA